MSISEPNQLGSHEDSTNNLRKPIDNNNSKNHNNRSNVVGSDFDDNAHGFVLRPSTLSLDDLSSSQDIPPKGELIKEGQDSRNNPKGPKDGNNKSNKNHFDASDLMHTRPSSTHNDEFNTSQNNKEDRELIMGKQEQRLETSKEQRECVNPWT